MPEGCGEIGRQTLVAEFQCAMGVILELER